MVAMPLIQRKPTRSALEPFESAIQHRIPQKEICKLVVEGKPFSDWTSIRIEQKYMATYHTFQFECTEESPIPLKFDALQFKPGQHAEAFVGGIKVLDGYIIERHVSYDATSHGIRLVGAGKPIDTTTSSVPLDKLGGHDNKTWSQFTQDIISHLGIKLVERGRVDKKPFDNIQVQPGEPIIQVIERYAKVRNILIGSTAMGELLGVGPHAAIPSSDIHEGYNILAANAVVRDLHPQKKYYAVGPNHGSDSSNGDPANKQIAGPLKGSSTRNKHLIAVADVADDQHAINQRAKIEQIFGEGSKFESHITMQGFFKDNNKRDDIWKAGEYYTVTSPSLILDGTVLGCRTAVYEQSERGSTTTLEMVDIEHMGGERNTSGANPDFLAQQEQKAKDKVQQDAERLSESDLSRPGGPR